MRKKIREEYQRNGKSDVVYFTQATHHPLDVFAYGREALWCFNQSRYLATIISASANVEIILNKDSRMHHHGGGWRTLNMKLLRTAGDRGLPTRQLLAKGESLTSTSIGFIKLRHQIAHGNLAGIIGFEGTLPDYSIEAREAALSHLEKAEQFVIEWYNTSPDVQDRRIMHRRWPETV